MPSVYIIIPCYNEDPAVVRKTVTGLQGRPWHVVLVDDGSEAPLAEAVADLPVTVLRHPINRGQGAALQTGMDYARLQNADVVVHFDADGQHDAGDIPAFLAALGEGADVVLGSRFLREADMDAVPSGKRRMLKLARLVNGLLTGVWLTDAHNGFRALGRRALEKIHLTEDRMAHASEILVQIHRAKLRVKELPTHVSYSEYSVAKGQSMGNALNILIDMLLEKWM